MIPTRVVVGVVCVFVGLLVLVVVIGLIRNQIDANGLAIALVPAITGVIVGGAIRLGRGDPDPPDKP